jgi:PAS domain S-box-containing protein
MTAVGDLKPLADPAPGTVPPEPRDEALSAWPLARTKRRRTLLVAAAGFLLLAFASVLAGYLAWRTLHASDALIAVADTREATLQAAQALLAADSAQRNYLLRQTPSDLAAFGTAAAQLQGILARLDPAPSLTELQRTAAQAVGGLQQAIDLTAAGQPVPASHDAATRQAIATAQRQAHAMVATSDREQADLAVRQRSIGTLVVLAIVTCLLGSACLALLLLRDTRHHLSRLARREARLHEISATLDQRVAERTRALTEANMRFEIALSTTGVTVALQNRDLRFTWISKGDFGLAPEAMLGRTDEELNPDPSMASVTAIKSAVVESGEPARREVRLVHDGAERWLDLSVQPVHDDSGAIGGIIAAAIDITRYKEQETRIRLLMREVTHRSLNLLAVIEAIMRQTASNATNVPDFAARFSSRLQSLAGSHDLLVQEDWSGASLRALVRSQLGHFADITDSQVEIAGPPLHLQPDVAQHIGMALHELAANAARYGALSVPGGMVRIGWRLLPPTLADTTTDPPVPAAAEESVELSWQEVGGPPVVPPTRRGFGRIVIERTVARGVHGQVKADYLPEGLRWTLTFPATAVVRT